MLDSQLNPADRVLVSVQDFHDWLERSGRGYLADGVHDWLAGMALLEIFKRAGVRGIGEKDNILDTLPLARDIIALRCKPKR
jgi:hypothetical protein